MNFSLNNRRKPPPKTTGRFKTRADLEVEVLRLRAEGKTMTDIAANVRISRSTVNMILMEYKA